MLTIFNCVNSPALIYAFYAKKYDVCGIKQFSLSLGPIILFYLNNKKLNLSHSKARHKRFICYNIAHF